MEDIAIVEAQPEDAEGIAAVHKATWLSTYPNAKHAITQADLLSKDFDSPEQIAKIRRPLQEPNARRVWIAKADNRVVAFCIAGPDGSHNVIQSLYVLPRYQGYRIGYRLMMTALDWLGDAQDIHVEAA